jgi:S1-C subfamily serine protease
MRDVDPLLARHFNLAVQQGVLITTVQDGSPAARAGLRAGSTTGDYGGLPLLYDGDIITAIDGRPIHSGDDLVSYLELQGNVGQAVSITVMRDGTEQQLQATLGSRPDE